MIPLVTLDLRDRDFDTMDGLVEIVQDLVGRIELDYPEVHINAVVISGHHLKMLRLEQYMKGMPLERVKRSGPEVVCGVRVVIDMGEEE